MSDDPRAVLMRDIFDAPDDDLPRLVLGDWLADHGDPRGEFIQIDVRLHAGVKDGAERGRLERRRREILARHALRWLGPLSDVASRWEFRRGFVHLEGWAERLLGPAGRAALDGPESRWVEGVSLARCLRGHLAPGEGRLLTAVTTLEVRESLFSYPLLCALMGATATSRVRTLRLLAGGMTESAATMLARCASLARLHELDLSGNQLTRPALRALAEADTLAGLRSLVLRGSSVDPETRDLLIDRFGDRVRLDA
ncbi:MAG: TIGR02996 domain-containing protein [Gemmataceae bacterium]